MNDPTPNGKSKPSRRVARIVLFVVGIPLLIAGLLAAVWWAGITKQRHQRTEWKNLTLERLAELSFTNGLVQRELAELKAAIEKLYNVKVVAVRTVRVAGKPRRTRAGEVTTPWWKKAIVKLHPDLKIDLF